jgi:glycosidase
MTVLVAAAIAATVSCTTTEPPQAVVPMSDAYRIYYEIFVASFYDSDGDGMGDLSGVLQKLDYLNSGGKGRSLEVGGIWLMPIMASPSYHKYDVADYRSVDPAYGTLEDFKALSAECAKRDVALIIDLPLNHTSDEHPWFEAAVGGDERYRSYYHFRTDFTASHHAVTAPDGKLWYYEGHFGSHMPDLNLGDAEVRREILDICKFWLDAGATGFRLDAVAWFFSGNTRLNVEFLGWLNEQLRAYRPDVYLVGEAWSDGSTIVDLYQSGLPSFFNFPFSQSTGALISSVRSAKGVDLARSLQRWYEQLPSGAIDAPFLTNHDHARSASALMSDVVLQKQAAAVYLLLPGNPFIYYGEEIGMKGSGRDENKRTALYWSLSDTRGMTDSPAYADDIRPVVAGIDVQHKQKDSLLNFYRSVTALKNRHPELARGTFKAIETVPPAVFAYSVEYQGKRLLVAHNLSAEPAVVKPDRTLRIVDYLSAGGKKQPRWSNGQVELPAYSTIIMR